MKFGLALFLVVVLTLCLNSNILSLFDGVTLVDLKTHSSKDESDNIGLTAEIALRIAGGIYGTLSQEGMPYFIIYEDCEAFYLVTRHITSSLRMCSYAAKLRGLKICKRDGRVLLPGTDMWMRSGYLNMNPSELHSTVKQGMSAAEVEKLVGPSYRQTYCVVSGTNAFVGNVLRIKEYICHTTTAHLLLYDNVCVTNMPDGTAYIISTEGGLPFSITGEQYDRD